MTDGLRWQQPCIWLLISFFSYAKRKRTWLRFRMDYIENELAKQIDFQKLLDTFAKRNTNLLISF